MWGSSGKELGEKAMLSSFLHTKKQKLKITHGLFRKRRSRFDNLRLSFLFLQDYHASYCFNTVFEIYLTYSSSILTVTSSFYCYAISCQEICCRWEHLQGITWLNDYASVSKYVSTNMCKNLAFIATLMLTKIFQYLTISPPLRTFLCSFCLVPSNALIIHSAKAATGVWLAGLWPRQPSALSEPAFRGPGWQGGEWGHSTEPSWPGRERVSSFLPCSLRPLGESCDTSRSSGFQIHIPGGLALQDVRAVVAADAALSLQPSSGAPPGWHLGSAGPNQQTAFWPRLFPKAPN